MFLYGNDSFKMEGEGDKVWCVSVYHQGGHTLLIYLRAFKAHENTYEAVFGFLTCEC